MINNLKFTFTSTLDLLRDWRRFLRFNTMFVLAIVFINIINTLLLSQLSAAFGGSLLGPPGVLITDSTNAATSIIGQLLSSRSVLLSSFTFTVGLGLYAIYLMKLEQQGGNKEPDIQSFFKSVPGTSFALAAGFVGMYMILDLLLNSVLPPHRSDSQPEFLDALEHAFPLNRGLAPWLDHILKSLRNHLSYLAAFLILILWDRNKTESSPLKAYRQGFSAFVVVSFCLMSVVSLLDYYLRQHVAKVFQILFGMRNDPSAIITLVLINASSIVTVLFCGAMIYYPVKYEREKHLVTIQRIPEPDTDATPVPDSGA